MRTVISIWKNFYNLLQYFLIEKNLSICIALSLALLYNVLAENKFCKRKAYEEI